MKPVRDTSQDCRGLGCEGLEVPQNQVPHNRCSHANDQVEVWTRIAALSPGETDFIKIAQDMRFSRRRGSRKASKKRAARLLRILQMLEERSGPENSDEACRWALRECLEKQIRLDCRGAGGSEKVGACTGDGKKEFQTSALASSASSRPTFSKSVGASVGDAEKKLGIPGDGEEASETTAPASSASSRREFSKSVGGSTGDADRTLGSMGTRQPSSCSSSRLISL